MMMHGVKDISATEDLGDITNPNDFLRELITVGMGQHAVLQTRQKSRESINLRAASRKFCGGYAPLGYNIVDENYVVNEKEVLAVRMILESHAAGKGYGYIIDKLAIMGVMSKRRQKKKISNTLKVLADGFDSDSVRQSLMEHEAQKKVFVQQKASFTSPVMPSRN